MKKRIISIALTVALISVLLLTSMVSAATTVWSGTTTLTEADPITIVSVTPSSGTWGGVNNWAVQLAGAGSAKLIVKVRNTGTVGVTVYPVLGTLPSPASGAITPTWNISMTGGKYIAATTPPTEFDFELTVTTTADVPLGVYGFAMSLTR
jgi:hypothetical protein